MLMWRLLLDETMPSMSLGFHQFRGKAQSNETPPMSNIHCIGKSICESLGLENHRSSYIQPLIIPFSYLGHRARHPDSERLAPFRWEEFHAPSY